MFRILAQQHRRQKNDHYEEGNPEEAAIHDFRYRPPFLHDHVISFLLLRSRSHVTYVLQDLLDVLALGFGAFGRRRWRGGEAVVVVDAERGDAAHVLDEFSWGFLVVRGHLLLAFNLCEYG